MSDILDLGSVIIDVDANVRDAVSGLKQVEESVRMADRSLKEVERGVNEAGVSMNRMARHGHNTSMAITQVGFAVEDFLTVVQTTGLSGGLRAAGNNMSFLASAMNPMAGLAVGIGTALAGILVSGLSKAEGATRELEDAFRSLREESRRTFIDLQAGFDDLKLNAPKVEGIFDLPLGRFESQRAELEGQINEVQNSLKTLQQESGLALGTMQGKLPGFVDLFGPFNANLFENEKEFLRGILEEGLQESIDQSTLKPLEDALARVENYPTLSVHPEQEVIRETLAEVRKELFGIAKDSILAKGEVRDLEQSLEALGRNEAISKLLIDPVVTMSRDVFQGMQEAAKERDKFAEQQEQDFKQVNRIIEQTRTPLEAFKKEYQELVDLQKEFPGLLNEDVFNRQIANMEEEFARLTEPGTKDIKINFTGIEAVEAGSAAGIARIQGMIDAQHLDQAPSPSAMDLMLQDRRAMPVEAGRPLPVQQDIGNALAGALPFAPLTQVLERLIDLEESKLDRIPEEFAALGLK